MTSAISRTSARDCCWLLSSSARSVIAPALFWHTILTRRRTSRRPLNAVGVVENRYTDDAIRPRLLCNPLLRMSPRVVQNQGIIHCRDNRRFPSIPASSGMIAGPANHSRAGPKLEMVKRETSGWTCDVQTPSEQIDNTSSGRLLWTAMGNIRSSEAIADLHRYIHHASVLKYCQEVSPSMASRRHSL